MWTIRQWLLLAVACAMLAGGCGYNTEYLVAVQVVPAGGTATAISTYDTFQFAAIGWYAPVDCPTYSINCSPGRSDKHQTLTNASWTPSDALRSQINSSGLATCVSLTSSPATITATAPGGYYGSVSGTGTLICN